MALKVVIILLLCFGVAYFRPNLQSTLEEEVLHQAIVISSSIFFFLELVVNLLAHGLCKGRDSYLRRDPMNILTTLLLVIDILCLTPLGTNSTFQTISKIRVLRILQLVQLRY